MDILQSIITKAKADPRRIVLPEGNDDRTLQAAARIQQDGIAIPILLGRSDAIHQQAASLGLDLADIRIIDPVTSPLRDTLAQKLFELRQKKGVTREQANDMITQPLWFGDLLIEMGEADGCVAGAVHSTADVVRTAIQALGVRPGSKMVSSFFLMLFDQPHHPIQGGMIYADCGLTIEPDAEQLADIALASADTARAFLNQEPRIAMLSFSTSDSAKHPQVDKVKAATALVKERDSSLLVDGEVQFDAAIVPSVAAKKIQHSQINGTANVLIFPSLEAGNIGYKITQRLAGAVALGPFLQGLNQAVNDLSRGCSADDIYSMVACTVVQAQMMEASS